MRNDSSNDINNDLSKDFMKKSLFDNYKKTVKKLYLEVCKMEKQKREEKLEKKMTEAVKVQDLRPKFVNDGSCGLLDVQSMFLAFGSILFRDCKEESSVVSILLDTKEFDSLECIVQTVLCANGKSYRRLIAPYGFCSKFILVGGSK